MKKYLAILMSVVLFGVMCMSVSAQESVDFDAFLRERNVPENIIENLPERQKKIIYDNIKYKTEAVYDSYEENYAEFSNGEMEVTPYSIPTSELKFTVIGFDDGNNIFSVFPSFYWLNDDNKAEHDVFAFTFNSNYWEIEDTPTLTMYMRGVYYNGDDEVWTYDRPTTMSYAGASFDLEGVKKYAYEAHGAVTIKKISSSATRKIILSYFDYTGILSADVGVTFGPFSITFTNTPTFYRETAEPLDF